MADFNGAHNRLSFITIRLLCCDSVSQWVRRCCETDERIALTFIFVLKHHIVLVSTWDCHIRIICYAFTQLNYSSGMIQCLIHRQTISKRSPIVVGKMCCFFSRLTYVWIHGVNFSRNAFWVKVLTWSKKTNAQCSCIIQAWRTFHMKNRLANTFIGSRMAYVLIVYLLPHDVQFKTWIPFDTVRNKLLNVLLLIHTMWTKFVLVLFIDCSSQFDVFFFSNKFENLLLVWIFWQMGNSITQLGLWLPNLRCCVPSSDRAKCECCVRLCEPNP